MVSFMIWTCSGRASLRIIPKETLNSAKENFFSPAPPIAFHSLVMGSPQ